MDALLILLGGIAIGMTLTFILNSSHDKRMKAARIKATYQPRGFSADEHEMAKQIIQSGMRVRGSNRVVHRGKTKTGGEYPGIITYGGSGGASDVIISMSSSSSDGGSCSSSSGSSSSSSSCD